MLKTAQNQVNDHFIFLNSKKLKKERSKQKKRVE